MRTLIAALCALLCALASAQSNPAKPQERSGSTKTNASAPQASTQQPATTEVKATATAAKQNHRDPTTKQQAKADTETQGLVVSGFVALFTLCLVVIAASQIGMFRQQLGYMRESLKDTKTAADAAKESADAARKSVQLAQETAMRQLRAYLMVDKTGIRTTDGVTELVIIFKNFGHVPAQHAVFWASQATSAPEEEKSLARHADTLDLQIAAVAPGATYTIWYPMILTDDGHEVHAGKKAMYLYGEIVYHDGFSPDRKTSFRYRRTGRAWLDAGESLHCEHGNGIT